MQQYKILAIVGKSASGKDTFLNLFLKQFPTFNKIKEYTTRPKRDEKDNNYKFVTYKDYLEKYVKGEIFGNSKFNEWSYGFSHNSLKYDAVNITIMNPQQLFNIVNEPEYDIFVLLLEASNKTRLTRSLYREACPDCLEICRRFIADEQDFKEYEPDFLKLQRCVTFNTDGTPPDQQTLLKFFVEIQEWTKDIKIV